jgi:hypothetical protein
MDRRNFLRSMLGVAAATALPSEVWPFKKIFLPTAPLIVRTPFDEINAICLEMFAKEIPDMYFKSTSLYSLIKKRGPVEVGSIDLTGIPVSGYMGPEMGPFFGLSRSPYPGRLGKGLLHSPATPENIVRFANELEDISKPKS